MAGRGSGACCVLPRLETVQSTSWCLTHDSSATSRLVCSSWAAHLSTTVSCVPCVLVWPQAGRIAEEEGAAALTLHARTADQLYYPPVDWSAIRQLVQAVRIPVIGNGDVYEGRDAVRMVRETGCAGGRGLGGVCCCLQRFLNSIKINVAERNLVLA